MIISQWDSHSLTRPISWLSQSEILTHRWLQLRKLETAAAVSTLFQKSWSPRINSNCVPSSIADMMRCKKMLMIKPSNCEFVSLSSQPPTWGHIHTWREFQRQSRNFSLQTRHHEKECLCYDHIIIIIIIDHVTMMTILISTHQEKRDNFQTVAKRPMLCPSPKMAQSYEQWQFLVQLGVLCLVRYNGSNCMAGE